MAETATLTKNPKPLIRRAANAAAHKGAILHLWAEESQTESGLPGVRACS
ncbi:hypothetical protein QFZ79_001184 [Arthrobacter sp. V4I6]|nr:hypothetical protein [Arthrobacter sp. V1I7]MDQ0853073.1 hypothetical protein [Arthrobacter sp. V4I6]